VDLGEVITAAPFRQSGRVMLAITVRVKRTEPEPGRRNVYLYDMALGDEVIVSNSINPECDTTRALLARGITGVFTVINAATGKPRTIVNIAKAAKVNATEGPYGPKFKPVRTGPDSPCTAESDEPIGEAA
jgi:hypothetical protein